MNVKREAGIMLGRASSALFGRFMERDLTKEFEAGELETAQLKR